MQDTFNTYIYTSLLS